MKKIVSFFAAAALVATMMTTSSCTKTCDAGYEGSDCKTVSAAKYYGTTWVLNGHDDQTPANTITNASFAIAAGSTSNVLALSLSSGTFGWTIPATCSSDVKSFTLTQTTVGTSTYTGSGTFVDTKTISLTMTEIDASQTPSMTYVYTLQATRP